MPNDAPPTIDPVAAARWQRAAPAQSPWLHDEVARRMEDRLQWIRMAPSTWAHWEPVRGGLAGQALLTRRYPDAQCLLVETQPRHAQALRTALARPWWRSLRAPAVRHVDSLAPQSVQMLWANMALHQSAEPQALLRQWQGSLAADGFLMFSCLGPDTLHEVRALYQREGWPPAGSEFTDMHDWGDMLVEAGFAEPVMDMERVTLTYADAGSLIAELRTLGANLHPQRHPALRGRGFRRLLEERLEAALRGVDGRLALTFEIIYGHALKPVAGLRVSSESAVSLQDMRNLLRSGRRGR
jgi:malonyl-CoA O-methyltransferase